MSIPIARLAILAAALVGSLLTVDARPHACQIAVGAAPEVVRVRSFDNQPVEITLAVRGTATEDPWLPGSVTIRNTSQCSIVFGWFVVKFPDVLNEDGTHYEMQFGWHGDSTAANLVARGPLQPGETVLLPMPDCLYVELGARLLKDGRTLADVREAVIELERVEFDNGTAFTPSGFLRLLLPVDAPN